MKELKPLKSYTGNEWCWDTSVFLAGSIENGEADEWQKRVVSALADKNVLILNPRRDDWDSTWEQNFKHKEFRKQVQWELTHLECAEMVAFYFDPNTKSAITLMELGLVIGLKDSREIFVCCPEGYWKKGNVDVICKKYGIKVYTDEKPFIKAIRNNIDFYAT